jgi:hypothetical protein
MSHHRSSQNPHNGVGIPFHQPQKTQRDIVHVRGTVTRIFGDANNGQADHMHFDVKIDTDLGNSSDNLPGQEVFLAVRYGDQMGLSKPIDNLQTNTPIEIQGEYISADKAFAGPDNSTPKLPVLHFTHHPLGFIVYNGLKYS